MNIRYLITLLLFACPIACLSLENNGFRAELSHVDSKSNFTQTELLYRAATRTKHRLSRIKHMQLFSSTNISSNMHSEVPTLAEYYMDLAIGTPPLRYSAIADTGRWTSGTLDKETFTFGITKSVSVPNITFGCSTSSSDDFNGSAGLVGLSRGELSLTSQLNTGMFSYCLTSFFDTNSTSPLLLGPLAKFSGNTVKSTPFVKNPSRVPMNTYYYLSLQGISLGTNNLAIQPTAFALQSDGTGGFIIDSGTTFTLLVKEAYLAVKNAIQSIVKLPLADGSNVGFDLCYFVRSGSSPPGMPNLIFHFDSADMVLPVDNYMLVNFVMYMYY
ncbi:hypothetical protein LUZ61_008912 [Rhynchospora tenuis]|uniref:Peptidase A1 domain-containing protein n=1 Tax=Rhynchospora tenuis TaxID=198213 RepID=A0AAD6EXU8_9POAL|nr:hypothetical protein LUZ61_008912 [Rhynchospora tenuis]